MQEHAAREVHRCLDFAQQRRARVQEQGIAEDGSCQDEWGRPSGYSGRDMPREQRKTKGGIYPLTTKGLREMDAKLMLESCVQAKTKQRERNFRLNIGVIIISNCNFNRVVRVVDP